VTLPVTPHALGLVHEQTLYRLEHGAGTAVASRELNLRHLVDSGFTAAQARAMLDVLIESGVVTRDYLDLRLRTELGKCKRDMLLWMLVMRAPVYAALIWLLARAGL
jgi:hypothetical protein